MNAFFWEGGNKPDAGNEGFQNWLIETGIDPLFSSEREQRPLAWQKAPAARYCHPREEHLLPLHVCFGMADKVGRTIFDDYILGKPSIVFLW